MKVVLTGGGSGGHITPILAVAQELKRLKPAAEVIYIGQRGDPMAQTVQRSPYVDSSYSVQAGKFRRYHGEGLRQLIDLKTMALNSRDVSRVVVGLAQSRKLLKRLQPDVVFVKGGFVGVPVGLAAAQLHIPYVTHDSDAIPGLANRIISKWAAAHAVALDKQIYKRYDPSKTFTVGVPVQSEFQKVTPTLKLKYKTQLGLEKYTKVVLVTGGGLGARRLNDHICSLASSLLEQHRDLALVHIAGAKHEQTVQNMYTKNLPSSLIDRVAVKGFIDNMYAYSGAADVIVTRAGATTMAEFALQQKACIIVPNPLLTGGHQLKNATYWSERKAAINVPEPELVSGSQTLKLAIDELLNDKNELNILAENLGKLARPNSALELTKLLIKYAKSDSDPGR